LWTQPLYERFTPVERAELDTGIGVYPNRALLKADLCAMGIDSPEMLARTVDVTHPLVRKHSHTGRSALLLNENWLKGIVGMDDDEARPYLESLYRQLDECPLRYEQ